MYLVSLYEKESLLEASLGGRVTAEEIKVLGEELEDLLASFNQKPFHMVLDHSKARRMDADAVLALADVKDQCLSIGATHIVSVAQDDYDATMHQTARLQQVLEGVEEVVLDARASLWARQAVTEVAQLRAA